MFNVCNYWDECAYVDMYVCIYVCMYEAANSVLGEVVRIEQMFINLGKTAFEMHRLK